MNIVERASRFVQVLRDLAGRHAEDWKQCPHCDSYHTIRNGRYTRHPWGIKGRVTVQIQRHLCRQCGHTYSEQKT